MVLEGGGRGKNIKITNLMPMQIEQSVRGFCSSQVTRLSVITTDFLQTWYEASVWAKGITPSPLPLPPRPQPSHPPPTPWTSPTSCSQEEWGWRKKSGDVLADVSTWATQGLLLAAAHVRWGGCSPCLRALCVSPSPSSSSSSSSPSAAQRRQVVATSSWSAPCWLACSLACLLVCCCLHP